MLAPANHDLATAYRAAGSVNRSQAAVYHRAPLDPPAAQLIAPTVRQTTAGERLRTVSDRTGASGGGRERTGSGRAPGSEDLASRGRFWGYFEPPPIFGPRWASPGRRFFFFFFFV
jgi:hypothetical protein